MVEDEKSLLYLYDCCCLVNYCEIVSKKMSYKLKLK